jgi:putative nucleotidyltransferase with HDIG domain
MPAVSAGLSAAPLKRLTPEAIVRRVFEISTLPQNAMRVMEVARDPQAGAAELKCAVEGDPALSARVLRVINSASSGLRTKVNNVQHAIGLLGFSQVRNLALTASVGEIFKNDEQIGTYRRSELWRHLVSVGICARLVALRCRVGAFEDAFLAGLLHDIGIIIADQHAHEHFAEVIEQLDDSRSLCPTERQVMGFDHCALGAALAETWKFPPVVRAAIEYHHLSQSYKGEGAEIVTCVEIANTLCTLKNISSVGRKLITAPLDACKAVGFGREDILVLARDMDGELERHKALFNL